MDEKTRRYNHRVWLNNEIRRNKDFIKALDESGHYFKLAAEDDKTVYYLDDYVSDDEFNAIINQMKTYLNENIEYFKKCLEEMDHEERNDIHG